jgi:hypothetical protein
MSRPASAQLKKAIQACLPPEIIDLIDKDAKQYYRSRSEILRTIILEHYGADKPAK